MVRADVTCSAVMVPSARSDSRSASFSATSAETEGSSLKMPPGDFPVTIAQVANVTRSAASRGGTSAPSASVTASWVSTFAARPAAEGFSEAGPAGLVGGAGRPGPVGLVGGGGISSCSTGGSADASAGTSAAACTSAAFCVSRSSSSATVVAPPMSSAWAAAISSAVCVFCASASSSTSSRCSMAYSMSFSTA